MKSVDKIQFLLLGIIIAICIMNTIIGTVALKNTNAKKNEYDVSMMKSVSVNEILNMFNDKKTHVVFFGREGCGICVDLLPNLQKAQLDLNFVTNYVDISKIDRSSAVWKKVSKKINLETSTNDENGKIIKDTYGNFLTTKGYTPCVIVISKGKQEAGFFGPMEYTAYKDWLIEHGI